MTIVKGQQFKYNGFGSLIGNIYTVEKTNDKKTTLRGDVYNMKNTTVPIATKDLLEAIKMGDYIPQ